MGVTPRTTTPGGFGQLARTPGVPAAFVLVLLAFGGFSLLLPVVPLAVVRGGGSELVAGATTGVFMTVTVLFQLGTPRVTGVIGYRWVLAIGSALLGLPSGLLAVFDSSFAVLTISGVRGAGFGMMTVAGSALVAELAPAGMLGRATSLIGLAVGISEAIFLPVGLWLLETFGLPAAAWSASAFGVVGLIAAARLPRVFPAPPDGTERAGLSTTRVVLLLTGPFLVMLAVTLPYGAAASFLSPALDSIVAGSGAVVAGLGLGLLGAGVIVGRTFAGLVSDRRGTGALVWPGLAVAALGMLGIAGLLSLGANPWWFLAPTIVFGLGFGAVQNEALVASFERMPAGDRFRVVEHLLRCRDRTGLGGHGRVRRVRVRGALRRGRGHRARRGWTRRRVGPPHAARARSGDHRIGLRRGGRG